MKRLIVAAFVFVAVPTAFAQGMKDMETKATPMKSDSTGVHKTTGVVKSVDVKNGAVTLAHEPVASMNWPAMTMKFKADDPKLLDGLTAGKKVTFEFTQRGKDYVVTSIK